MLLNLYITFFSVYITRKEMENLREEEIALFPGPTQLSVGCTMGRAWEQG